MKCMQQVAKQQFYHLLSESDYYLIYRQFCETSAKVTNW